MTQEENSKVRDNNILLFQALIEDIRISKNQMWVITSYSFGLLGAIIWFYRSFKDINSGNHQVLVSVCVAFTLILSVLYALFMWQTRSRLETYRDKLDETKDQLGIPIIDRKRNYFVELALYLVFLTAAIVVATYPIAIYNSKM